MIYGPMKLQLPSELWFNILSFLDDHDVLSLRTVGSVFLEASLDRRYKKMEIVSFDRGTVARLERLQDPFIAKRVRKLYIYTSAVNVLASWQGRDRSLSLPDKLSKIKGLASQLLLPSKAKANATYRAQMSSRPTRLRTPQVIALLMRVIPQMVGVRTYFLDWSGTWETPGDPKPLYLQTVWDTLGSNLRVLNLFAAPSKFSSVSTSLKSITTLEEVHVTLPTGDNAFDLTLDSVGLAGHLLPLYGSSRATLKAITIASYASLDMSAFFAQLGHFPKLQRARICVRFRQMQLLDPAGLANFLESHAPHIERLELYLSEFLSDGEWTTKVFPAVPFPCLKALVLILDQRAAPAPAVPIVVTHLLSKLETLIIEERYHNQPDLYAWTNAFSELTRTPNLRNLDISLYSLNKPIIDLLAVTFPLLETLRLRCITIGTAEKMLDPPGFISELALWAYPEWKLRSVFLRVRRRVHQGNVTSEDTILAALVRSIPSIRHTEVLRHIGIWTRMG